MRSPEKPAPAPILIVFTECSCCTRGRSLAGQYPRQIGHDGHDESGSESPREDEALMVTEIDAAQPDQNEGRGGKRAEREARGHLAENGSATDQDRIEAEAGRGL